VSRVVTPAGGEVVVQVLPPSFVTMIEAMFPPSSPTATQVAVLAETLGAHDTELTFTSGGALNVVCHCGAAAATGTGLRSVTKKPHNASTSATARTVVAAARTVRTSELLPPKR
jgi:hypothetical protein